IEPGKPIQNAFIEAFNSRLRDECLNEQVFLSLEDARHKLETWRMQYNCARPHSSLGYLSPAEYVQQHRQVASDTVARSAWPANQMLTRALQRTTVSVKEHDRFSSSLRTCRLGRKTVLGNSVENGAKVNQNPAATNLRTGYPKG